MKSRSFFNRFMGQFTSHGNSADSNAKNRKKRTLSVENLEERQMLSVSPYTMDPDTVAAIVRTETLPASLPQVEMSSIEDTNTPKGMAAEEDLETILITGYIESTDRHEVIANCTLTATWTVNGEEDSVYATTDEHGFYTFNAVAADTTVNLAFISGAYNLSISEIDTTTGNDIVGLNMSATLLGQITGRITDSSNNPVTNIAITAYHDDENFETTQTNEDGTYIFENLLHDDYSISVDTTGLYKRIADKNVSL